MIVSVFDLLYVFDISLFVGMTFPLRSVREVNHCDGLVLSVVPRWGLQQYYN